MSRTSSPANCKGRAEDLGACHLLLDFTHVEYLNSMELGTLIVLHKRVKASGGRLTLFNLKPQVYEEFTVSRLQTLLGICREDAELPHAVLEAVPDLPAINTGGHRP